MAGTNPLARSADVTRICTINVKYSSNLGDGVIAECLEYAMRRLDPAMTVDAIDLAGRRGFGDGLNRSRARILTVLGGVPQPVRRMLIRGLLSGVARVKLRPGWAEQLRGCDAVVLGGGQLLADADLNFPIKVGSCLGLVSQARLPVAVYGVGVGGTWSAAGRRIFRAAMAKVDIRAFIVRDGASRQRAQQEFGHALDCPVTICPDPAVLVQEAYAVPGRQPGPVQRIGLCISHPGVLRLHADSGQAAVPAAEFFIGMVRAVVERGLQPVLFTNGAGEDDSYLNGELLPLFARAGLLNCVTVAARPRVPRDLVELIASLDAVVAHRLHASIIAYGLRVPHVGLNWDSKVRSFFAEVERAAFVVEPEDAVPTRVMALLDDAIVEGIDDAIWQRTIDRSHSSAVRLLDSLFQPARAREGAQWRQHVDAAV